MINQDSIEEVDIINPTSTSDEVLFEATLRPQKLAEYVGQEKIKLPDDTTIEGEVGIGQIPGGFGIEVELKIHVPGIVRRSLVLFPIDVQRVADCGSHIRLPVGKLCHLRLIREYRIIDHHFAHRRLHAHRVRAPPQPVGQRQMQCCGIDRRIDAA